MILLGSLVQVKGFGFALVSSRKRWMASLSFRRDRNTPRLRRFFVSLAKKPSMALSQEADVELSHLKEELISIEQASIQGQCEIQFDGPRPPGA
jgi:hypothetical protein